MVAGRPSRELSASEQGALRDLLTDERASTLATIATLASTWDDIVASSADVATDDEHDPDGATIAFERAHVQSLLDQARTRLDDLDHALDRLTSGVYGICAHCGDPIPLDRLRARPAATTCVACAPRTR
jgi:DnaK suppressor protein